MELDTRPPQFPAYPGNRPADASRFELRICRGLMSTMPDISDLRSAD